MYDIKCVFWRIRRIFFYFLPKEIKELEEFRWIGNHRHRKHNNNQAATFFPSTSASLHRRKYDSDGDPENYGRVLAATRRGRVLINHGRSPLPGRRCTPSSVVSIVTCRFQSIWSSAHIKWAFFPFDGRVIAFFSSKHKRWADLIWFKVVAIPTRFKVTGTSFPRHDGNCPIGWNVYSAK